MYRMTTKDTKTVTIGGVKFTQHHIAIFILTFFRYFFLFLSDNIEYYLICYIRTSYSLFHASRKTFSNVKNTISDHWLESCDTGVTNSTCRRLKPDNLWNKHHLFENKNDAKLFLGELDAIFLLSYSIVN